MASRRPSGHTELGPSPVKSSPGDVCVSGWVLVNRSGGGGHLSPIRHSAVLPVWLFCHCHTDPVSTLPPWRHLCVMGNRKASAPEAMCFYLLWSFVWRWTNKSQFKQSWSTQSSGAVWKSRWLSWAPVPNKPMVSVDVKQHFNIVVNIAELCESGGAHPGLPVHNSSYGLCGRKATFRKLMAVGIASVWSEIRERVHRVLQDYGKGAGGRGEPRPPPPPPPPPRQRRCFMPSSLSQSSVTHPPPPLTSRRWGGSLPRVAPATSTLLDWVRRKPVTGYPQSLTIARPGECQHLSANADCLFQVKAHSGFSLNEHRLCNRRRRQDNGHIHSKDSFSLADNTTAQEQRRKMKWLDYRSDVQWWQWWDVQPGAGCLLCC